MTTIKTDWPKRAYAGHTGIYRYCHTGTYRYCRLPYCSGILLAVCYCHTGLVELAGRGQHRVGVVRPASTATSDRTLGNQIKRPWALIGPLIFLKNKF